MGHLRVFSFLLAAVVFRDEREISATSRNSVFRNVSGILECGQNGILCVLFAFALTVQRRWLCRLACFSAAPALTFIQEDRCCGGGEGGG